MAKPDRRCTNLKDIRFFAKPQYKASWALIVGIDNYKNAPPLSYAVSDASEIREVLVKELGFPSTNITYLVDGDATKENILKSFMRFARNDIELDDRIFVFFAGHGQTKTGIRGEVGYLVAFDSDADDLSTFIRWDDLTRTSELVPAKHMLFVMDACYGGLALIRTLHAGSARFLKDMMLRYARQVLTAGKADEVVADSGGPLPSHSIFTGHLIEGMQGKAATAEGVITANGLMAYVYQCVANDQNSNQTPHYGYFDGDGDFVFAAPELNGEMGEGKKDLDKLVVIPFAEEEYAPATTEQKVEIAKTYLGGDSSSIKLHDFIIQEVRRFLSETNEDNFPQRNTFSSQQFSERFSNYEASALDLGSVLACTAYWAKSNQLRLLQQSLSRCTDPLVENPGSWGVLRWYPLLFMHYFCGIAAVAGQRYDALASIFSAKVIEKDYFQTERPWVQSVARRFPDLAESFRHLEGYQYHSGPLSEHLYKTLQPPLDNILFIGRDYEPCFDEFELLFALTLIDLKRGSADPSSIVGRFWWKHDHGDNENSPFFELKKRAETEGHTWLPLQGGLFDGSLSRFRDAAEKLGARLAR
jgi:hypothetical protein